MNSFDIIIIGGGAAGYFTAINIAEANKNLSIAILERGKDVLTKVRISGGGRCNVTHACFDATEMIKNYPRGEKELRGPFHAFGAAETVAWFERHGVALKTEADGRMFPVSDSSQTIIDCMVKAAEKLGLKVFTGQSVQSVFQSGDQWKLDTQNAAYRCRKLIMATGSNPKIWELLTTLGHKIVPPVPSLFTFNIKDSRITNLPGVSAMATVKVIDTKLVASGPLLITHWGMSGPAILKLSAWGARILAERDYKFKVSVNWLHDAEVTDVEAQIKNIKQEHARKLVSKTSVFGLPNRLWENLVAAAIISGDTKWADLNKVQTKNLISELVTGTFEVNGKSTFKEEFVTAGGVDLKEVNFKTMESKVLPNLYFAGEIVNIDAITGGFNFQNAWTSAYIISKSVTAF